MDDGVKARSIWPVCKHWFYVHNFRVNRRRWWKSTKRRTTVFKRKEVSTRTRVVGEYD